MSHVIKSNEDIKKISNSLENLRKKGYSRDIIEEILVENIPLNNKCQIKYDIANYKFPALFCTDDKMIQISEIHLKKYIDSFIKQINIKYPFLNKKELFNYYLLLTIIHEIEHSYQFLIGNRFIDFPYQIVIEAYKKLFSINKNDYNFFISKCYLKQISNSESLLERNANIEAYDLLVKVTDYEGNIAYKRCFEFERKYCLTFGYKSIYNGSVEETYRKSLLGSLYNTFPQNENIPLDDRVRYGLKLDKETRKKVLKYKF